jgi:hypothetical protein
VRTGHRRLALGSAMVAVIVGSVLAGAPPASASELCTGSVPAGQVRVAVVVDYGTEPGAPGTASARCLTVPSGTTGGQLLKLRSELLHTATPRYAGSGLLCALDGFPFGDECGEASGSEFRYWSYWSGTSGSWVYGQGNPFVRRVADGDIEGWRFVSAHESAAPPPRLAPDAGALFPSLVEPSTAPASPPAGADALPPPSGSGEPDSILAGAGPSSSEADPDEGADRDEPNESGEPPGQPTTTADGDRGTGRATTTELAPPLGEIALHQTDTSDGPPVATIAGGVLVAAVAGAAALRLRRSSS